jgi:hypothetical protein
LHKFKRITETFKTGCQLIVCSARFSKNALTLQAIGIAKVGKTVKTGFIFSEETISYGLAIEVYEARQDT